MEKRTIRQNASLHRLYSDISRYCMENSITTKDVLSHMQSYEVEVTDAFVKSVWRAIQQSITGSKSTTELNKEDLNEVYREFAKFWSEVTGQTFEFPSYDSLAMAAMLEEYK